MLNKSRINRRNPAPLYYQLQEMILEEIKNGHYKIGDMIPTEKELSEMLQISRTTVRQAIAALVNDGWLYRIQSKGTFVTEPKVNQSFVQSLESFDEQMYDAENDQTSEVLDFEVITPPTEVAQFLNLQADDKVIFIHRKRYEEEVPVVMIKTYLPYKKCMFLLGHDLFKENLYTILNSDSKTSIRKIERMVEAVISTAYDVEHLNINKGKAIQQFISVGYNMYDEAIEYSIARYRGDKNSFKVIITPDAY